MVGKPQRSRALNIRRMPAMRHILPWLTNSLNAEWRFTFKAPMPATDRRLSPPH